MDKDQKFHTDKELRIRVILALLLAAAGVALVNIFTYESVKIGIEGQLNHFLRGLLFSILVLTGVWAIRKRFRSKPANIDFQLSNKWFRKFLLGMGLIIVPIIITVLISIAFGWGGIKINTSTSLLWALSVVLISTLLTDALPEEVLFRGFVYSSLGMKYNKLISSILSIALFAFFPFVMVFIQETILGYEVYIGGSDRITTSYFITMIFFGSFMQYLRLLTKSAWTSIGFHTVFVFMNQLMGTESNSLIQITDTASESSMQIVLISLVIIVFVSLLIYPRFAKRPIGWKTYEKGLID